MAADAVKTLGFAVAMSEAEYGSSKEEDFAVP
jgi:hypothetical protein